ncbi:ABC transporter domain-containing protein [Pochonia chlamydosporia 170]|uniref:ABC transporter domain-containing protein n=1 Tax=Pochonia chlamydosporia 170 TaxID=1380566 RepID=A0A179F0G5_METCM|nr:ABC transporter domain-containing protein [Pochonia chlamydosporia 170]OAQ58750.1 ABC transporter domain-containing protein [Pochonia chlamydosporia 170]
MSGTAGHAYPVGLKRNGSKYSSSAETRMSLSTTDKNESELSNHKCSFGCDERRKSHMAFCPGCPREDNIYCQADWMKERRHDGCDSRHRQIPVATYDLVDSIFTSENDPEKMTHLHEADTGSLWFGLTPGKRVDQPELVNTDVYQRTVALSKFENRRNQYPSLVSFIGTTGSGKSTLIKALLTVRPAENEAIEQDRHFPTPVPGLADGSPNSADVHLYADGSTLDSQTPFLFADCEGLDGGDSQPLSAKIKKKMSENGVAWYDYVRQLGNRSGSTEERTFRSVGETPLRSTNTETVESMPGRTYAVRDLYPRMLYSFSEIICFVTQQPNTTEVALSQLIVWADKSLTKSVNQPALPRVVIVINGTRNHLEEWLDEDTATKDLLHRFRDMPIIDHGLRKIAEAWSNVACQPQSGPKSVHDLIKLYFTEVRVIYVPSKELVAPDVLQDQVLQLRRRLLFECQQIQNKKRNLWTRLNTTQLHLFFNNAFIHFTRDPDRPFDFHAVLKSVSPPPQNFSDYITHLIEAIEMANLGESPAGTDDRLARLLASYMSFATLKNDDFSTLGIKEYAQYFIPNIMHVKTD